MIVIGIDPGKDGGFAAIYPGGEVKVSPMPVWTVGTKKRKGGKIVDIKEANALEVRMILKYLSEDCGDGPVKVILEKTGAFHRGASNSMYFFGRNVMAVEVVLLLEAISYETVLPLNWMRSCGLPKKKSASDKPSVPYVRKKYPHLDLSEFTVEQIKGICDALCMAEHGLRKS